jgi:putative ABC transport system permease protein
VTGYYDLSTLEVGLSALLIFVAGAVSLALRLGLEKKLAIASVRTIVQLILVGYVLSWIFEQSHLAAIGAILVLMTVIAGVSAVRRTSHRFPHVYLTSISAVMLSSWLVTAIALSAIIEPDVWRERPAQYAIPLLGMLLGNALTGIALGLDQLGKSLAGRRSTVELLLSVGATRWEAARPFVKEAVRTGMIPIINSMMVVGLVSLPGMMTGQLLSGVDPLAAVEYQIMIMFMIAASTALGTIGAVVLGVRQLFNERHQFCHRLLRRVE